MTDLSHMRKQYHLWRSEQGDGFDAWDVDRLIELTTDLPIEQVEVSEIAEIDSVYWFDEVQRPTVRSVIEHARLIDEVDVSFPIIMGPGGRIMDGMHRIARAVRDGIEHLSARRLPELRHRTTATFAPTNSPTTGNRPQSVSGLRGTPLFTWKCRCFESW